MFEYFVRVLDGFAVLSDHFVVFFCALLSLYGGPFGSASLVYFRRGFSNACSDVVVLEERRKTIEM